MVGGILAAAGGEVGVGNEPGPEAALVGREGGVGDVPGEGAGRTSGEVAPEDVLGGAWQRAAGEVTGAVLDQLGVVELLLVLVIVPAFPVAGLRVVGDDAPVVVDSVECLGDAGADKAVGLDLAGLAGRRSCPR